MPRSGLCWTREGIANIQHVLDAALLDRISVGSTSRVASCVRRDQCPSIN